MNTTTTPRKSLAQLAAEARELSNAGQVTAELALEGQGLTAEDRAFMEKAAQAGDPEMAQALIDLSEAREGIFSEPFARAAHFRLKVGQLRDQVTDGERPDPETILATIFSLQSAKMRVRGGEPKPAIALLKAWKNRRQATLYIKNPISWPASYRKNVGQRNEVISARGENFLSAMTVADQGVFFQVRDLLAKMPQVLLNWIEGGAKPTVRQAVWLALHFFPGAQVLDEVWKRRTFDIEGDLFKRRDSGTMHRRFQLSKDEFFVVPDDELAQRLMERLKVLAREQNGAK